MFLGEGSKFLWYFPVRDSVSRVLLLFCVLCFLVWGVAVLAISFGVQGFPGLRSSGLRELTNIIP